MTPLIIFKVENGFLVMEDYGNSPGYGLSSKKWIAKNERELGELIEKLVRSGTTAPRGASDE